MLCCPGTAIRAPCHVIRSRSQRSNACPRAISTVSASGVHSRTALPIFSFNPAERTRFNVTLQLHALDHPHAPHSHINSLMRTCRWLAISRSCGANKPYTSRAKNKRPRFTRKCAQSFPRWFRTRPSAMALFRLRIRAAVAAEATGRSKAAAPDLRPLRLLPFSVPHPSIMQSMPCRHHCRRLSFRIRHQCCV